jgi:phosphoglucosamine mutase
VLELMQERKWQLGGENSGHIICLDKHTTGDGIVSALQVLHAVRAAGQPLDRLVAGLHLFPQVLVNVRIARGTDPRKDPLVQDAVRAAEPALKGAGRLPVPNRAVIRVMVEAIGRRVRRLAQASPRPAAAGGGGKTLLRTRQQRNHAKAHNWA